MLDRREGAPQLSSKEHTVEEIIGTLRQAEVALVQGIAVPDVCRRLGVTEQTCYRWRKEYGGLGRDQARRLKDLERKTGTRSRDPLLGKATSSHERRTQCTHRVRVRSVQSPLWRILADRHLAGSYPSTTGAMRSDGARPLSWRHRGLTHYVRGAPAEIVRQCPAVAGGSAILPRT
jgi:putative transposase